MNPLEFNDRALLSCIEKCTVLYYFGRNSAGQKEIYIYCFTFKQQIHILFDVSVDRAYTI